MAQPPTPSPPHTPPPGTESVAQELAHVLLAVQSPSGSAISAASPPHDRNTAHHQPHAPHPPPESHGHASAVPPARADEPLGEYYAARIAELEEANATLRVALDSSRQREEALHRSLAGYRDLLQQTQQKRDALADEVVNGRAVVEQLNAKLGGMISDNESLRAKLRRYDEATSVRNANSLLGRGALALADQRSGAVGAAVDESDESGVGGGGSAAGGGRNVAVAEAEAALDRETALRDELTRVREQLKARTVALNDAYNVVAQLTAPVSDAATKAKMSALRGAAGGTLPLQFPAPGTGHGHGGGERFGTVAAAVASAASTGDRWLVREKAALQVRVAELEGRLRTMDPPRHRS